MDSCWPCWEALGLVFLAVVVVVTQQLVAAEAWASEVVAFAAAAVAAGQVGLVPYSWMAEVHKH